MEFNREAMLQKYADLRSRYVEPYEPDFSHEHDTVRYVKIPDVSSAANLYSRSVLRHFEAKRALFPRQYKILPKGANPAEYDAMYFAPDGNLHLAVYTGLPDGELICVNVSEQLVLTYRIQEQPGRKPFVTFLSMEWTEYDADSNPVSVEGFRRNGSLADGVLINSEYYQYADGRMVHAERYAAFDSDDRGNPLLLRFVPDRIYNPEMFSYDFRRTEEGVLCERTHYWSRSKTYTASILLPEKELLKMEKNGLSCFM